MKAKRQYKAVSISATMLDGIRGQVTGNRGRTEPSGIPNAAGHGLAAGVCGPGPEPALRRGRRASEASCRRDVRELLEDIGWIDLDF